MDAAVRARTAARETVEDIEPPRLRAVLLDRLAEASMAPGVLVLESALGREPSLAPEAVIDRGVGVQLIYEGLRLTRSLAHTEPWTAVDESEIDADLEILAADILVSRGFYLLARTEVSDAAVETVRAFGRDQTHRQEPDADADVRDRNLEADIFVLAVRAGVTAVGTDPSESLLAFAAEAARCYETLPPAETVVTESVRRRLTEVGGGSDDPVASSIGDR
jgi:hypothetical protein